MGGTSPPKTCAEEGIATVKSECIERPSRAVNGFKLKAFMMRIELGEKETAKDNGMSEIAETPSSSYPFRMRRPGSYSIYALILGSIDQQQCGR